MILPSKIFHPETGYQKSSYQSLFINFSALFLSTKKIKETDVFLNPLDHKKLAKNLIKIRLEDIRSIHVHGELLLIKGYDSATGDEFSYKIDMAKPEVVELASYFRASELFEARAKPKGRLRSAEAYVISFVTSCSLFFLLSNSNSEPLESEGSSAKVKLTMILLNFLIDTFGKSTIIALAGIMMAYTILGVIDRIINPTDMLVVKPNLRVLSKLSTSDPLPNDIVKKKSLAENWNNRTRRR